MESASITVYGAGYVGLVTGACLAKSGHTVQVLDIDRTKLASLAEGRMPFFEPDLDATLAAGIEAGRLAFAHRDETDIADSRFMEPRSIMSPSRIVRSERIGRRRAMLSPDVRRTNPNTS